MKYLSIDPATATGKKQAWASFEDRKIVGRGRCTLDEVAVLVQDHDVVFCEDQFIPLPRGRRSDYWRAKVESVISLAHAAGQIEQMVKLAGKEFYYIGPSIWQTRILGAGSRMKSGAREQAAVRVARMYVGTHMGKDEAEKRMGVDIGCAVCIGICGIAIREFSHLQERNLIKGRTGE